MPTVLRIKGYRFHFYSNEGSEPAHIHIRHGNYECKYWLSPIALASNRGMPLHKVKEIEKIISKNHAFLLEKYDEFHRS